MAQVPAGEFWMGCNDAVDNQCLGDEKPYHKVYLDTFYLDKYDVTVEQYASCAQAGKCSSALTGESCDGGRLGRGNNPINCVDWYQAKAYCEWVGKRLPSEAEWEKAARGTDGRKYPWGNREAGCDYAIMWMIGEDEAGCGRRSSWPVGSRPLGASPYGAMDMAGNVWNWVVDWYDEGYYKKSPDRNPTGPASGAARVLRGGSWHYYQSYLRSSARYGYAPFVRSSGVGFRCARTR